MERQTDFAVSKSDRYAYASRQSQNYMLAPSERREWAAEVRSLERQAKLHAVGVGFTMRCRLLGRAFGRATS